MSLKTYPKKRVDIFVEQPALQSVLDALDGAEVQGYTVTEATQGRGHSGRWQIDDSFNNATNVVVVVCILDAARVDAVVEAVFDIVQRQIGVLTVSDVMVVRPEHF
jgi:nitrogen regulatory protein PII